MLRHTTIIALFAVLVVGVVSGQSQRSPATLNDLLNEVRGLRGDLSRSSGVSTRALLLAARVQVQEHRIAELNRQLLDLQREVDFMGRRREGMADALKMLEDRRPTLSSNAQRAENEENIRASIARLQEEVQRESTLRQRLTDASNALLLEQNRWTDFNSRLDELERALATAR
jgi:chromosome segregation ATPase